MAKSEQVTVTGTRQQKILELLQEGARTWDQLRAATKMNDDNLGFLIGELLNLRKIWTLQKGDVRVYGIERRTGLVPRFANLRRRATDSPT
jgi:predicted acyltransferase